MILYLDTSALIKRYVMEAGSTEVITLIDGAAAVGSALLARAEMAAALARAARFSWVERSEAEAAWQDFISHWGSFARLALTPVLIERAARLAWEHDLRGYAAVHLAAALTWQEALETPVILATYDRELWRAARQVKMAVWPEGLIA